MNDEYVRGQWAAFDRLLQTINSLDTSGMSGHQVRSMIYQTVMEFRPR